jgi:hypothetical protein
MNKTWSVTLIMVLIMAVAGEDVSAKVIRYEIDSENIVVIDDEVSEATYIVIEQELGEQDGDMDIGAALIRMELSIRRAEESDRIGEIMQVGIKRIIEKEEAPEGEAEFEYSVLPGTNREVVFDVSKAIRELLNDGTQICRFGIYGRDQFGEAYAVGLPADRNLKPMLEISYVPKRELLDWRGGGQ